MKNGFANTIFCDTFSANFYIKRAILLVDLLHMFRFSVKQPHIA